MFILPALSIIAFTGLLVHFAFHGVPLPTIEKSKGIIDESVAQDKKSSANDTNNRLARIFIPSLLSKWPWPRRINPHYIELEKEGAAWMAKLKPFTPEVQDAFDRCKATLLACLAYPDASKEHARAGCDLMYLLFVYDEYSDRSTPAEVREQKAVIMDALHNPRKPRPNGEWVGGELTRQFWERTIQNSTQIWQKRFISSMDEYLEAVVEESIDREDGRIPDVRNYTKLRRVTGGLGPSFAIAELGLDIPDEVMSHPIIQEISLATNDMIAFANDVFSYNVEQTSGKDVHNMVTCIMKECDTDANGAILWIEQYLFKAEERFHTAKNALPEWEEPLNSQVRKYCDGLGQWVRANRDWSFESERYFGNKGAEIMERGMISLLPKDHGGIEVAPTPIDGSLFKL